MTDEELQGSVIPGTRGPIRERSDGTLTCVLVIQPLDKSAFLRLLPDIDLPVFISRQSQEAAKQLLRDQAVGEEGKRSPRQEYQFGRYAAQLRLSVEWMGNPEVWSVVGSDSQYLEWCRDQPCAHCKKEPHWEMERWIRSEPAHVRRVANGSGESIKPSYSAIPLCHKDHAEQHQKGESAIGGKDHVNKLRMHYLHNWVWERMRLALNVGSMAEAAPSVVLAWAREHGIEKFLPRCYLA